MFGIEKLKDSIFLFKSVILLNLFDIIFTLYAVQSGYAIEANPFMDALLQKSPLLFATTKLSLVSVGTYFIVINQEFKIARIALKVCFFVYGLIFLYHVFGILTS